MVRPTDLIAVLAGYARDVKEHIEKNHDGRPDKTNECTSAYAEACISVAEESSFPVIDIWSKMQQVPDWVKTCLRDGLHLTPIGNRIIFEEAVEVLRKDGISLKTLPVELPPITEINHCDSLKAFRN